MHSYGQKLYPLRYWLFVAYGVGIPGFIDWGPAGHGIEHGLFNPYSILQIILTLGCGIALFLVTLSGGKAISARPLAFRSAPLILLLLLLCVTSVLSPKDNVVLSIYRLLEWALGFLLFISVYTREPLATATALGTDIIGKICWVCILLVLVFLVIDPPLAYQSIEEVTGAVQVRLGGAVIHPIRLGLMAATAFWHTLFFGRRQWRSIGCSVALLTMLLAYSRIAWLGFVINAVLYACLRRNVLARVITIFGAAISVPLGYVFSDKIISILGRGEGTSNLTSLTGRTAIWAMARQAIARRPWVGYGYIDGVKNAMLRVQLTVWGQPGNLHNEVLQAIGGGGIIAGLLVLYIYSRLVRDSIRAARRSPEALFLLMVVVQLVLYASGGIILGTAILQPGAMLIVCLICTSELNILSPVATRQARHMAPLVRARIEAA